VGLTGDPPTFSSRFNAGGVVPGIDRIEEFLHSGLTVEDDRGQRRPQLAEAVPTIDNGLWKLHPDGRMETTWTIREGVVWHDGAPFTTDDLVFTARLEQDPEMPLVRSIGYSSVERIDASDARALTVHWHRPYIWADTAFSSSSGGFALALPRHLLERPYIESKAGFLDLSYWTDDYVGTGPFKVKEFGKGSHLIVVANDRYTLGRPRIDEIEMKIIPDWGTLGTNILAGVVEVTPGGRIPLEWATQVRDQWQDGRMEVAIGGSGSLWFALFPQFLTPNPAIITNVQFRRALVHAIDRQQLAEGLLSGVVPPAHSMFSPGDPENREIERSIVRYEYDPRKAAQMIEALGYAKGPDGFFRDTSGQRFSLEIRTIVADTQQKLTLSTIDFWRQIGVNAEAWTIPLQLARDAEQYSTHPGFLLVRNPANLRGISGLHSSRSPVPENRFSGLNYGRYKSAELDGLIDKLFVTIPVAERSQLLGQIVRHMSENLNVIGLVFNPDPILIGNRLRNVPVQRPTWNTHEWDVGG
jgi:peptide/nickel transport system substrate-binding protein